MTLEIEEITSKLLNLRSYSKKLSQRLEHEIELPDDAVPFLIERIEAAYARYESASAVELADAHDELKEWLIRSSRFYLCRIMLADLKPWEFEFPKARDFYFR